MSLLETVAVLALEGLLLATLSSALIVSTAISSAGESATRGIVARRHLEHLLERTFSSAGLGAAARTPISRARADEVVLQADLDGDGLIDTRSAERSAIELRRTGPGVLALRHRVGRQVITVERGLPAGARLLYFAADGRPATRIELIRVVAVPTATRPLYFAVAPPAPP